VRNDRDGPAAIPAAAPSCYDLSWAAAGSRGRDRHGVGGERRMRRRAWLVAVMLAAAGCSSSTKSRPKSARSKRPKGPQTMGNLLLDAYIDDLKSPAADKKINAARELANMGSGAKKAVPALEKMANEKDKKVSEAARQALASIRK
jgi:hypothetical protein